MAKSMIKRIIVDYVYNFNTVQPDIKTTVNNVINWYAWFAPNKKYGGRYGGMENSHFNNGMPGRYGVEIWKQPELGVMENQNKGPW